MVWHILLRKMVHTSMIKTAIFITYFFKNKLSECRIVARLVGLNSDMRQKLRSHRDKELYDWLGGYESVGAVFCGLPRSLAFGPHFLYKKLGPNNPDHLTIKINCTTSNFVHILPFANKYFVHSKLGARRNGTSMTITFRRGIPPTAAKVMYPHQYSKIFR